LQRMHSDRALKLEDSYAFCDWIADSMAMGVPSFLDDKKAKTVNEAKDIESEAELDSIHMIRLPQKGHKEPLAVTNIYPGEDGNNWMNHGLIASNKEYAFVFVHSSPRVLSPETIESVYWSSGLSNQLDRK